ncbi:hypothetical protein FRC02_002069 [Tulasnella sp. 418]|nr:hypothetical protein FRC02_002069 [Tulasnella sp. 418]
MGPSRRLPVLEEPEREDKYFPTLTVFMWYISLDLSLLVAGGAVCMKLWLLEYRRSNSSYSIPYYNRALKHQETFASLKRWFIPEFGNLLGCIILLNLIPFFAGLTFHSNQWRTGNAMFSDIAYAILGVYSAFLACTIIVGVLVPISAYKTPMSNLLSNLAQSATRIPTLISRKPVDTIWYTAIVLPVFIAAVTPVSVVWVKHPSIDWWFVLLWAAPMLLTIGFGLRNGLKAGRVATFVPAMGLLIGVLATTSMTLTLFPEHFSFFDRPAPYYFTPFIIVFLFGLLSIGLSQRFSPPRSRRNFPVGALLFAASAIVLAALVSCNFSPPTFIWSFPTSRVTLWGSMVILSFGSLLKEGDIEEDTRESEALAWLITQTSDLETLHSALACIPSIANTPLRRQTMLKHIQRTLTLLINSLVDVSEGRCLNGANRSRGAQLAKNRTQNNQARLAFYLTCLAEVSHVALPELPRSSQDKWWSRLTSCVGRCWFGNKWYHLLAIPGSADALNRELRFAHHWHRWLPKTQSDLLHLNLEALTRDPDPYLRVVSRAALCQLHPSCLPVDDISAWPSSLGIYTSQSDFRSCHGKLVAIRMVTIRIINEYHRSKLLEPSILRYLFRYCDTAMNSWPFGWTAEDSKGFEALMTLAYIVLENDSSIIMVTLSNDTIPLKVARCVMALKRWHDSNGSSKKVESSVDSEVHSSFALSLLGVIARYLNLAADDLQSGNRNMKLNEGTEIDEDSLATGMKYLEAALLELAGQAWADIDISSADFIASSWAAMIAISRCMNIHLNRIGNLKAATSLVKRLKSRALNTKRTVFDRVSAINAITETLNNLSDTTVAEYLISQDTPYLDIVIRHMFEEDCVEIRVAALSTLLETHLLHPQESTSYQELPEAESGPSSASVKGVIIVFGAPQGVVDLRDLYGIVLRDPRSFSPDADDHSQQILISKIISVAYKLPHTSLPSLFFESETHLKALSLARIASQEDKEVIHASARISAIRLFGLILDYEIDQKGEAEALKPDGIVMVLSEIAKGLNLLTDDHVSIPLDDASRWSERLIEICTFTQVAQVVFRSGLIEALCDAVGWIDFGKSVEGERERIFAQLTELRSKILKSIIKSRE